MIIEFEKDNNETYKMNNNEIARCFRHSMLQKGVTIYKSDMMSFAFLIDKKIAEGYTSIRFIKGENYRWISLKNTSMDDIIHALNYIINL